MWICMADLRQRCRGVMKYNGVPKDTRNYGITQGQKPRLVNIQ